MSVYLSDLIDGSNKPEVIQSMQIRGGLFEAKVIIFIGQILGEAGN